MMKILKADVERLVQEEYARASDQHGARFNSPHEAYSVMKEEFEEAVAECNIVNGVLNVEYWNSVKQDSDYIGNKVAGEIQKYAINAACEMIQLAAMALKAQKGYGNEEGQV